MSIIVARLIKISFVGLAAAAVWLTSALFTAAPPAVRPSATTVKPSTPPAGASASVAVPPLSRFEPLMKGNLFGQPGRSDAGPTAVREAADRADLPSMEGFQLVGLMLGPRRLSLAVVEDKAKRTQEMVAVGDKLGQGVVREIAANRVVVEVAGRRHQLVITDRTAEDMEGVLTVGQAPRRPEAPPRPRASAPAGSLRLGQAAGASGGGLRVMDIDAATADLGLRTGDVIVGLAHDEAEERLTAAAAGEDTELEVARGGRRFQVRFAAL